MLTLERKTRNQSKLSPQDTVRANPEKVRRKIRTRSETNEIGKRKTTEKYQCKIHQFLIKTFKK